MDAADRAKSKSLDSGKRDLVQPPKKSYLSAALCLFLYGMSFGIAIPAFPAITLKVFDGDSALSARYYGIGMAVRYGVEFLASPITGTMADVIGRKPIFLLCFLCISIEYFTLAVTPDIFTLICCRAVAGLGDSGLSTAYAIVSDIAAHNDDEITAKFGQLSGIIAISFLSGPLIGGYLSDINPRLCLGISGIVSSVAFVVVMCTLQETLDLSSKGVSKRILYLRSRLLKKTCTESVGEGENDENAELRSMLHTGDGSDDDQGERRDLDDVGLVELHKICGCCAPVCPHDCCTGSSNNSSDNSSITHFAAWWVTLFAVSNPLPAVRYHLSKAKVRDLMLVIFFINFCSGINAVFYLFVDYKYHAKAFSIGLLLVVLGAGSTIVSLITGFIIPRFLTEKQAVIVGLVMNAASFLWFGFAPTFDSLYFLVVFSFSSLADIALKGMVVKADVENDAEPSTAHQGSLQGALGSIRCLASSISSLIFAAMFSHSIGMNPPCPWIVFVVAGGIIGMSVLYLLAIFSMQRWRNSNHEKQTNVLDCQDGP